MKVTEEPEQTAQNSTHYLHQTTQIFHHHNHNFIVKFHRSDKGIYIQDYGAGSSIDGRSTMLQAGSSRVRFPMTALLSFFRFT
jgi:hypothetical protein